MLLWGAACAFEIPNGRILLSRKHRQTRPTPFSVLQSRSRADSVGRLWVKRKPSKHRELSGKYSRGPCSESNFKTEHSCSHTFPEKCASTSSGSCREITWKWSYPRTIYRRQESRSEQNNFSSLFYTLSDSNSVTRGVGDFSSRTQEEQRSTGRRPGGAGRVNLQK